MSASIHNDYSGLEKIFQIFQKQPISSKKLFYIDAVFCFTGVWVQLKNLLVYVLVLIK